MSESIRSHRDLRVWQEAMDLAENVYRVSGFLPASEAFGLAAQLKRAAVSIPANIAEGYGRESTKNYVQFLRTARGSVLELETQAMLAKRVDLIPAAEVDDLLGRVSVVSRMLSALIRSLQQRPQAKTI